MTYFNQVLPLPSFITISCWVTERWQLGHRGVAVGSHRGEGALLLSLLIPTYVAIPAAHRNKGPRLPLILDHQSCSMITDCRLDSVVPPPVGLGWGRTTADRELASAQNEGSGHSSHHQAVEFERINKSKVAAGIKDCEHREKAALGCSDFISQHSHTSMR